uniref:Major facilitator superfamily (MFS) profile domain-containing protein n=1 Tax=Romanomermis culicivorax TaxID=13658 RepID=A0A915JR60_ROMCU
MSLSAHLPSCKKEDKLSVPSSKKVNCILNNKWVKILITKFSQVLKDMKDRRPNESNIDKIIGCGKYQFFHSIVYQLIIILLSCNMSIMAFLKKVPNEWTCRNDSSNSDFNRSKMVFSTASICLHEKYANSTCSNYVPFGEQDFYSIVSEWNLICSRAYLVYLSITVQMAGLLFGSPLCGQMADYYGRKWVLFGSVVALTIFGNASAFVNDIISFTVLRFLIGFTCGSLMVVNVVYITEFLTPKHRLWVTSVGSWPVGQGLLALLAWTLANWRLLTIVVNCAALPALPLLFFMEESPHWAVNRAKRTVAHKSLSFVVKMNRSGLNGDLPMNVVDNLIDEQNDNDQQQRTKTMYHFWHIFAYKRLASYFIIISLCTSAVNMVTYTMLLDSDALPGNHFLNFFIMTSLVRFFSASGFILADYYVKPFGRKLALSIPALVISVASFVIVLLKGSVFGKGNYGAVLNVATFLSMFMTSPIYITSMLSTSEVFPTPIRNVASGFAQIFIRSSALVAPVFLYLAYYWAPGPYLICAVTTFLSGICWFLFMPETKGHPLPDRMPSK